MVTFLKMVLTGSPEIKTVGLTFMKPLSFKHILVGIAFSSTLPNGMNDYINAIYAQDWKRGGSNALDEPWTDPVI